MSIRTASGAISARARIPSRTRSGGRSPSGARVGNHLNRERPEMRHITQMLLGSTGVLWEGEGGGGGGGGTPAAFTAPDGMPAEFVGKDAGETLAKLWTGYGAL